MANEETPKTDHAAATEPSSLVDPQLRTARARTVAQIAAQRAHVTGSVRTLGRALRGAGEMLEEDDLVAQCLHFASDKVESVAGYMADLDPVDAGDDLRTFARERPAWFFGGAFVLGLALGRFARSTAEATQSQRMASRPRRRAVSQNVARGAGARVAAHQPAAQPGAAKS